MALPRRGQVVFSISQMQEWRWGNSWAPRPRYPAPPGPAEGSSVFSEQLMSTLLGAPASPPSLSLGLSPCLHLRGTRIRGPAQPTAVSPWAGLLACSQAAGVILCRPRSPRPLLHADRHSRVGTRRGDAKRLPCGLAAPGCSGQGLGLSSDSPR